MPKVSRLTRDEMDAFYAGRSRRISGTYFDMAFIPAGKGIRTACVVSKKAAPKAVARNAIRRRFKSIFSKIIGSMSPSVVVFTARPGVGRADFAMLKNDIEALVEKAGLSYNTRI